MHEAVLGRDADAIVHACRCVTAEWLLSHWSVEAFDGGGQFASHGYEC